jgi:GTP-binding protein HflX
MSDDGMSTVSWLYDEAEVLDVEYDDEIHVEFKARDEIISKARHFSPLETKRETETETVPARQ